jgi:ribose-phosphate pyrophosphokinase
MIAHGNSIKLFAGNGCKLLANEIADNLNLKLGAIDVGKFSDGEISVNIQETVRGKDVFVIQSTSEPVNDNLMELLVITDALKRASAGRITAVMPYFAYARQDRKSRSRDPISAKLVADVLTTAGIDRLLTMDLHTSQLQGFFNIPVDHLLGLPILSRRLITKFKDKDLVVVSPDVGSAARARAMAAKLNASLAIIDKRRPKANQSEIMNIVGEIEGRTCLMVDDMIDTAGTITQGAQALKDKGAKEIYACCTHAVLSGPALERLKDSVIKELFVLNTYEIAKPKLISKITQISVAPLFAEAIERIYGDLPVSKLYE